MHTIPYGRQFIDDDDIKAVTEALQSNYLTTGPRLDDFENAIAEFSGARHGVAVSSGTAALHAAMHALEITTGDEVIVPPMTFAATANCVLYAGGTPVFADVLPESLLIDPCAVLAAITDRTKAIIAVDYTGQPCDWAALREIATSHNLPLIADGCHALGASYAGQKVGSIADMTIFSFHPVKHIATGEGGMIVTDSSSLNSKMRQFRNHGITTDARSREQNGAWFYEMTDLGYNYRMTDIQAALGLSQMKKLPFFLQRRRAIARCYDEAFANTSVQPLTVADSVEHAYHLYVVKIENRDSVYMKLREVGINTQIHYIPVHLHPYYKEQIGTRTGLCPNAEAAYKNILSIPIFPSMTEADVQYVIDKLLEFV